MAQSDFTKYDFTKYDFTKLFDVKALLNIQRKNIEALSEANKLAFEGFQAAGQRQAEILSQIVDDNSSLARDILLDGTPEEKIAKHTDLIKKNYENSVANWHLLTAMIGGAGEEASNIISSRIVSSLAEFKSALDKNTAHGKSSAQKK